MEQKNKNPTASITILLLNSSKIQNYIEELVVGYQPMVHDFSGSQIAVVYMYTGFWILKQSEAVRNKSFKESHS